MRRNEGPASVGSGAHPTVQGGAPECGGPLNGSGAVEACGVEERRDTVTVGGVGSLRHAGSTALRTRRTDGGEASELARGAAAATAAGELQDVGDQGGFVCRGASGRSRRGR